MTRASIAGLFAAALTLTAFADPVAPERKVEGRAIVSAREPGARIEMPAAVRYVGADRFVLYGMADCELHAFVEADADKKVERLYRIQFERYLDSRPELHHRYDSPRQVVLGGQDFYLDTWLDAPDDERTPGSDGEHIRALIGAKGYRLPPNRMSVRLVHLLDEAKRKELMLIYSEDLEPTGYAPKDLREGGARHGEWAALEGALVERALSSFSLQFVEEAKP